MILPSYNKPFYTDTDVAQHCYTKYDKGKLQPVHFALFRFNPERAKAVDYISRTTSLWY